MAAKKSSDATRKPASRKPSTPPAVKPLRELRTAPDGPYRFHEAVAILLGGFCAMFVLSLVSYSPADLPSWVPFSLQAGEGAAVRNFIGPVGAVMAGYAYFFFGAAAYLVPAILAWWAVQILTGARPFHARNLISATLLVVSASCLIEYQGWFFADWAIRLNLPKSAGGFTGYGFGHKVVEQLLGSVGSAIVVSIVYGISLVVITGIHPFQFFILFAGGIRAGIRHLGALGPVLAKVRLPSFRKAETPPPSRARARAERIEPPKREPKPAKSMSPAAEPVPAQGDLFAAAPPAPEPQILDSTQRARKKLTPEEAAGSLFDRGKKSGGALLSGGQFPHYELPSLSILQYADDDTTTPTNQSELLAQQSTIVTTLATFGVEVKPGNITRGPTITRYELYPSPGLRVNRITALEADLARATKAER
ncbi:MAG: DNA translocase FtsK 4TM domain-containing protein, partial [Verrucomicrobia bacterium]|nr:DNA translocase FtsK 4TM domain-containing protein [Verrucomicrobiota bacterium]